MKNLGKYCSVAVIACAAWVGWSHLGKPAYDPWVHGAKAKDVELLFTIESKHGSLMHLKGDQYELAMPIADIKSVLAFSDRPNRIAFRMDPEKFAHMVHTGANNFDIDPPNLVISWGDHKYPAAAYEVTGHRKAEHHLLYSLKKLGDSKITNRGGPVHQKGKVAIFIDAYDVDKAYDCMANGAGNWEECDKEAES